MRNLSKEVKDVYTGYFIQIALSLPDKADTTIGVKPFLLSLRKAGIESKIYAYNVSPSSSGYVFEFEFFICPADLNKLYELLGNPVKTSGTLNEYSGLEDLSVYYTPTKNVKVEVIIRESLVIDTKGSPSSQLRTSVLQYVTGAGFTVAFFFILGNSIIMTSVPRDIKADNNAKLMVGSILPILGHMQDCQCEELCQGKVKQKCKKGVSSEEIKRKHKCKSHKKKGYSSEEYKYKYQERIRDKNKYKHISTEEFKWKRW